MILVFASISTLVLCTFQNNLQLTINSYKGLNDPVKVFSEIESEGREAVLECQGSISHHHGIGKLRRNWTASVVGQVGFETLKKLKKELDPLNVFCCGSMGLTPATITFSQKEN